MRNADYFPTAHVHKAHPSKQLIQAYSHQLSPFATHNKPSRSPQSNRSDYKKGSLPKLEYLKHLKTEPAIESPSTTAQTVYLADKPLSEVTFSAQSTEPSSEKQSVADNPFSEYGMRWGKTSQHKKQQPKHTPSWLRPRIERELKSVEKQYRECIRLPSREREEGEVKRRMKGLLDKMYSLKRQLD